MIKEEEYYAVLTVLPILFGFLTVVTGYTKYQKTNTLCMIYSSCKGRVMSGDSPKR